MLTVTQIKNLCFKYGLVPSKKYGQNYLIHEHLVNKIVEAITVNKKDTVVEVGAGFGILTLALAEKAKKVISYEIEKKLADYWTEKLATLKNVEIIWGNFLHQSEKLNLKNYKVAANLPYQITSKIIRLFLTMKNPPSDMVFMIQKEVGERIIAKPGEMSLLAVSTQYYAEPKIICQVSRNNFWPVPKVDSAVLFLKMKPRKKNTFSDEQFFQIAKAGFSHPRKMLLKNLLSLSELDNKDKWVKIFTKLNIDQKIRAEGLSVDQWKGLAREWGKSE
jgi:16S rRNA (adenine1518-N6/adenine1519-N6)-dimethyltransferase